MLQEFARIDLPELNDELLVYYNDDICCSKASFYFILVSFNITPDLESPAFTTITVAQFFERIYKFRRLIEKQHASDYQAVIGNFTFNYVSADDIYQIVFINPLIDPVNPQIINLGKASLWVIYNEMLRAYYIQLNQIPTVPISGNKMVFNIQ